MYKIAVWYESELGRNDGNPLYVTATLKRIQYYCDIANRRTQDDSTLLYFSKHPPADESAKEVAEWFMKEVDPEGIKVQHLRPYGNLKPFGTFDLNIWVDWGEDALGGVLPYKPKDCPKPMAYWASDTHLGYEHRLKMALQADHVFCAQQRAVEEMRRDGVKNVVWLPHAVEPMAYPMQRFASKRNDVCFVGHINSPNRIEALDRMFREFPNFWYGQRQFEEAAEVFGRSKICFNISMLDDINMRVFEVLATQSLLLTNSLPTLPRLFKDGVHLVTYDNMDEAVEKARFYIENDRARQEIALAGYEAVMKEHTFAARVKTMLQTITQGEKVYAGVSAG